MARTHLTAVIAVLASAVIGTIALAEKPVDPGVTGSAFTEITVTATRLNVKPVVSVVGWPRAPVGQVTLSYGVSTADLDLTTSAGASELERRVNETAMDVCQEIGRQYPESTPSDAACAKAAAQKAMVRAHELIATAKKTAQ
jgi:UrcA family protein